MITAKEINLLIYKYIGVNNGYLGDFSYKSHREFYPLYCNLDINPEVIEGTTRQRFIKILTEADSLTQATIIEGILEKYPISFFPYNQQDKKLAIKGTLIRVVQRLKKEGELEKLSQQTESPVKENSMANIKKKLQIFISSTYLDLKEERQQAVEAILRNHHIPAGMELFQAANKTQFEVIKQWIEESDIYMLILGGRYGSIEPTSGLSYTELEYQYALEINKPVFSILLSNSYLYKKLSSNPNYNVFEEKEKERYQQFKELVKQKMIVEISTIQDIKTEIGYSIRDLEKDHKNNFQGWVRPSDIKKYTLETKGERPNSYEISPSEKNVLFGIISVQDSPEEAVSAYYLKDKMEKNGYSQAEVNIGVRKLLKRGFIEIVEEANYQGETYTAYDITKEGGAWILENEKEILSID